MSLTSNSNMFLSVTLQCHCAANQNCHPVEMNPFLDVLAKTLTLVSDLPDMS